MRFLDCFVLSRYITLCHLLYIWLTKFCSVFTVQMTQQLLDNKAWSTLFGFRYMDFFNLPQSYARFRTKSTLSPWSISPKWIRSILRKPSRIFHATIVVCLRQIIGAKRCNSMPLLALGALIWSNFFTSVIVILWSNDGKFYQLVMCTFLSFSSW